MGNLCVKQNESRVQYTDVRPVEPQPEVNEPEIEPAMPAAPAATRQIIPEPEPPKVCAMCLEPGMIGRRLTTEQRRQLYNIICPVCLLNGLVCEECVGTISCPSCGFKEGDQVPRWGCGATETIELTCDSCEKPNVICEICYGMSTTELGPRSMCQRCSAQLLEQRFYSEATVW